MNRTESGSGVAQTGVIRELWSGFLDDVMGPKEIRK
jgi:hypothetical protein